VSVRLTPEALSDVKDARSWYADRDVDLSNHFVASFESVLQNLAAHPEVYPVAYRQVRRALLRGFPYCVFYVLEPEGPLVLGCFHARRSPSAWRRRAGA